MCTRETMCHRYPQYGHQRHVRKIRERPCGRHTSSSPPMLPRGTKCGECLDWHPRRQSSIDTIPNVWVRRATPSLPKNCATDYGHFRIDGEFCCTCRLSGWTNALARGGAVSSNASNAIDTAWNVSLVGKNSCTNFFCYFRQQVPEQTRRQVATQPHFFCNPVAAFRCFHECDKAARGETRASIACYTIKNILVSEVHKGVRNRGIEVQSLRDSQQVSLAFC